MGGNLFEGAYPNQYSSPLLRGIQAAVHDKGVNLLAACGVDQGIMSARAVRPAWPDELPSSDFIPVADWNTDGLIIITPLFIQDEIRFIQKIHDKGFPILFIGSGAWTPMINVDNEGGMRQAMEHLVEHGHRDIAFIAGIKDDGDSHSRLKAYREAVREFGLNDDPRLVEFGAHRTESGYDAMKRILQSSVKISAVACSNDNSAVGALRAIKETGLSVPWDIALTGFDDNFMSLVQVPPMTSVHYPLFETGYRALLLLCKRIEFGPGSIPEETRINTYLVPRQSCGCMPEAIASTAVRSEIWTVPPDAQNFRENISRTIKEKLSENPTQTNLAEIQPLCDSLVETFFRSIQDEEPAHFQTGLSRVMQQIEAMEEDAHPWQAAISILRAGARALYAKEADALRRESAENLADQARTIISESARRRYMRMQFRQAQEEDTMGRFAAQLLSSLDEEQVYSTLENGLPQVGIGSGYVALFEPQGDDPVGGSQIRTYQKDSAPLRFATRQFPPAGLYPEDKPFSLALLPLVFQDEKMGYVAFDGANFNPLGTLVRQIASALKSTELHGKVRELSLTDGLTRVYNRRYLDLFMEKELVRSKRFNRPLSTIMIDIDHFKTYNDSFGHPAGDEALRWVAEDIQGNARRGLDMVSRYGGEEFLVVLPETEAEGARIVAENIRKKVEADTRFQRKVCVSLGIASLKGEQLSHASPIEQADRALYQAKNQGRNQTVTFEEWMRDSTHFEKKE